MITQKECKNAKERIRYHNARFKNCISIETFPKINIEYYKRDLKIIVDYQKQVLNTLLSIKEQVLLKDMVSEALYIKHKLYFYDTLILGFNYGFGHIAPQNTKNRKISNENDLKKEIEKRKNIRNAIIKFLIFDSFESFLPQIMYCHFKEKFQLDYYDNTFAHIKKVYNNVLPAFRELAPLEEFSSKRKKSVISQAFDKQKQEEQRKQQEKERQQREAEIHRRKIEAEIKKQQEEHKRKEEERRNSPVQKQSDIAFDEILKRVQARQEEPYTTAKIPRCKQCGREMHNTDSLIGRPTKIIQKGFCHEACEQKFKRRQKLFQQNISNNA